MPLSSPLPPPNVPLVEFEVLEPAVLLEGDTGARPPPSPTSMGAGRMPFILAERGVAGMGIAAEARDRDRRCAWEKSEQE